jgi:hypothetical protein
MTQKNIIIFGLIYILSVVSVGAQNVFTVNEYGTYIIRNGMIKKIPIDEHLIYPQIYLNFVYFRMTDKAGGYLYDIDNEIVINDDLVDNLENIINNIINQEILSVIWQRKISHDTLHYAINDYYYIDIRFSENIDLNGRYDPYFLYMVDENCFILIVNDDRDPHRGSESMRRHPGLWN